MKLWKKHLFSHLLSSFFASLIFLISIYLIVDLSIQHKSFSQNSSWLSTLYLYGSQISQFLDLFLTAAFLFATLKVIIDLNDHQEFLVLQLAGISSFRLAIPFFQWAFFLQLISFSNQEWIHPFFTSKIENDKIQEEPLLFSFNLSDGSKVVYRNYDSFASQAIDLFWLQKENVILHCESLDLSTFPPKAFFVQKMKKKEPNSPSFSSITLEESIDSLEMDPSLFSKERFKDRSLPLEERKLSTLFQESSQNFASKAYFHYKLALGTLPYLLFLVQTPFFLCYSRNKNRLLPISISLLTLIFVRTALDAALIMTENQLFSPHLAIWTPILLPIFFLFFSRFRYILRYGKKRS